MIESTGKGTFLKKDSRVVNYMVYPRFLMDMDLSETTKLIYVLLLDRGRLSVKQGGWADEEGNVYIYYDIKSLATDCGKSEGTVKTALLELEKADLILREKQEVGKGRKIYVKVRSENCPPSWSENYPHGRQNFSHMGDRKLAPSNNKIIKTNIERNYSYSEGESL